MAYNSASLSMVVQDVGHAGPAKWSYFSADATATVDTSGYITDGGSRGMKVGDLVEGYDSNLKISYMYRVHTVSATYPGAVDLSDGTVIGSGTNTD